MMMATTRISMLTTVALIYQIRKIIRGDIGEVVVYSRHEYGHWKRYIHFFNYSYSNLTKIYF